MYDLKIVEYSYKIEKYLNIMKTRQLIYFDRPDNNIYKSERTKLLSRVLVILYKICNYLYMYIFVQFSPTF